MSDLQVFPLAIPGGIDQSAPIPREIALEELKNFISYRARLGLRTPISLLATIQDDQGTPADVSAVLDIADHNGQLWTVSWSSGQQDVYLHSMNYDGSSLTLEAVAYTTVASKPNLFLTSFAGGTATAPTERLYITDYDQSLATKFWDGSLNTLTEDLDNDSSAETVKFSLMIPYKFHLWGTGFYEGTTTRPEMLRFSQPGLISGTDDAGGSNPKEWFSADHRSVGRRNSKITALAKAGDILVVFQKNVTHGVFGSNVDTWTREEIDSSVGCVGPRAATSVERLVYFWSPDGPWRTDGSQVQYLGDPIQQIINEVDFTEDDALVGHSLHNGLVYFIVSPSGQDSYELALTFDHRRQAWMKEEWLDGASSQIQFAALVNADAEV